MNDKELATHKQNLINANPIGVHIKNEFLQAGESLSRPYIGGIFSKQRQNSGLELTPHEHSIKLIEIEVNRRKGWQEKR